MIFDQGKHVHFHSPVREVSVVLFFGSFCIPLLESQRLRTASDGF